MGDLRLGDKLYVVSRRDLLPGQQAVQAMHALREFVNDWPEKDSEWYKTSNYVAFLNVADEPALESLCHRATAMGISFSMFREPDFDDALTACVFEAGEMSARLCKGLPLALK